ncbi:MAG: helix-turn-helix transcriptional regulator [Bacteroidota bacterium]
MKKNENKQSKNAITALKKFLKSDGRKLTWLSAVTKIQYQRLQRIVNQGYDPSITEAVKIAGALKKPITALFPLDGLKEAFLHTEPEMPFPSSNSAKKRPEPHS